MPRLDRPPFNRTTSRERFCQCQNQGRQVKQRRSLSINSRRHRPRRRAFLSPPPLESAILLLEILQPLGQSLSGGHRTASSFHEYVCSVTPIFLTDSATVLPRPTSTSTSRSIGDDLLGQFFLSAWHGMPSFGFDTTRLSLWKWCRLRGAGQGPPKEFAKPVRPG